MEFFNWFLSEPTTNIIFSFTNNYLSYKQFVVIAFSLVKTCYDATSCLVTTRHIKLNWHHHPLFMLLWQLHYSSSNLLTLILVTVLGIWWFLMGMDRNYRGIDGHCREIDLIRGIHPPQRERYKCTKKLVYSPIDM